MLVDRLLGDCFCLGFFLFSSCVGDWVSDGVVLEEANTTTQEHLGLENSWNFVNAQGIYRT